MATDSSADRDRPALSREFTFLSGQDIFLSILNTLEEPFFLLDETFRFSWHNKACNDLYHAVSGKDIGDNFDFNVLLTSEQQDVFRQHLEKVAAGEKIHFEWKYQINFIKWVSVSLYPFRNAGGTFAGVCGSLCDITEKKLTELVLIRNTAVLNNIGEGVLLVDAQFRVLTFNRQAIRIFNLLNAEVYTGVDFLSLLPPHRRATVEWYLQQAMTGVHLEYEIEYPDGLWLFISYLPVNNPNGNIEQISISFRNISKRKKAEEQARAGEIRYQALVNSLSEGVILQTLDRQILTVNKSAMAILGIDADRLREKGFPSSDAILVDEYENEIGHEGLLYKSNGQLHGVRNKVLGIRKPHGIQWLKLNSAVVTNARQKDPYTIVISFEDITREKRISQEMEVLAMLARETVNAVMIMHPDGELLWVNEGFVRLTGYSAEEMVGKTSRASLMGPDTDMNTVNKTAHCRQHGLPFLEEFQIYTKGGKKIWTRVQGQSIRQSKGSVPNYFLIITDITEEKKTQQDQRRMEEERLQYELEQQKRITHVILETKELERNLLGRELHDNINQILAAIRMQLSFCIDNFSVCEPVLSQCRDNIIEAIEETRRLSHRMVMPRFSERSLPQVLKTLSEHYQYTRPIQLDTTGWDEDRVPIPVKEAFFRIVQEQLSNIYKHARATEVVMWIATDHDIAVLSVRDNGLGFDPTEKKEGIGLSNIRSRAECCGGTAQFISAPGQGCTLLVQVPTKNPA
jgi:PAS domain S-box-containing protein